LAATGQKLSELVAALPTYEMVKLKAECSRERIAEAIELAGRAFAGQRLNRADGVRIDFADGWVHLRGSNTEPIVRIIAEARDAATVQALIAKVKAAARL
jgi:phosphomannomutase